MKHRNRYLLCFGLAILLAAAFIFSRLFSLSSPKGYLKTHLHVDIGPAVILMDHDTHGGFHGDGSYLLIADCSQSRDSFLEQTKDWSLLPLPEELAQAVSQVPQFSEDFSQGRWYFQDRHSHTSDPSDYALLHSRYSYNFTLAVYDTARDLLYYYELDT